MYPVFQRNEVVTFGKILSSKIKLICKKLTSVSHESCEDLQKSIYHLMFYIEYNLLRRTKETYCSRKCVILTSEANKMTPG